jgi:cytochrome c-type biogenesis protein CcmH
MKNFFFLLLVIFTPLASYSVEPSEVLDDPFWKSSREIFPKIFRCLVCQNESIDESSATLAKDLRILVRERLLAGDNKDAVLKFIVDRYGEFVLLNPSSNGSNLILWLSGPLMLLIALIISFSFIKANQKLKRNTIIGLSDEEKRELEKIIREE